ncbi:UNVERIFIED_CONTAM: hypothetical protein Sradi_3520600 [Sesamum radiatum]|uniref:Retrotransposon Copia-like N-terminal domain-containing protein n=1 Tax=Sesamum radiatum TaxID=300843 RepID=A0AAW2QEK8_SESRA
MVSESAIECFSSFIFFFSIDFQKFTAVAGDSDLGSPTKQDTKGKKAKEVSNHLKIQATNDPATILVSNLLDGSHFLSWSYSIKIALRAKMKLGFINGKDPKPEESDENYEQWERVYGMVIS